MKLLMLHVHVDCNSGIHLCSIYSKLWGLVAKLSSSFSSAVIVLAAQARGPGVWLTESANFHFLLFSTHRGCVYLQLRQDALKTNVVLFLLVLLFCHRSTTTALHESSIYIYAIHVQSTCTSMFVLHWLTITADTWMFIHWLSGQCMICWFTGMVAGLGISLLITTTLITYVCVVRQKRQTLKTTGEWCKLMNCMIMVASTSWVYGLSLFL